MAQNQPLLPARNLPVTPTQAPRVTPNNPMAGIQTLPGQSPSGDARSWWDPRGWNQDTQNILLGYGLQGVGGLIGNQAQGAQNEADRQLQRELQQRALEQSLQIAQMGDRLNRDQMGLQATQMDPLFQQKSRQRNAIAAALLGGGPPQLSFAEGDPYRIGQFSRPSLDSAKPFFTPEARAGAEGAFYNEASRVSPGFAGAPNLNTVGYGGAGNSPTASVMATGLQNQQAYANMQSAQQQALQSALGPTGAATGGSTVTRQHPGGFTSTSTMPQQQQRSGGGGGFLGFLKKALPIASMAIPFVGPAIGMSALAATGAASAAGIGSHLVNRR